MRYLGIDYGEKRIGLAVSDDEGRIAFPHSVISVLNLRSAAGEIARIARETKVAAIVVGLPRMPDGRDTDQTRATTHFIELLREYVSVPVESEDELLTTKIAEAHSPRDSADASAAALILQAYLDRKSKIKNQNAK